MTADIHLNVWHETAEITARLRPDVSANLAYLTFAANCSTVNVSVNRAQVLDLQQKLAALEWPAPQAADVEFDVERAR